jgi:protoporphyrinogen IX oxidase
MLWLLGLHIAALLCWCAAIVGVPVLLLGREHFETGDATAGAVRESRHHSGATVIPRRVFTWLATPAALLTIASGTALFLLMGTVQGWLLLKLVLVALLVGAHVCAGLLMLRAERAGQAPPRYPGHGLSLLMLVIMMLIFSLVLAKPGT